LLLYSDSHQCFSSSNCTWKTG